jgi:hypothetical protein
LFSWRHIRPVQHARGHQVRRSPAPIRRTRMGELTAHEYVMAIYITFSRMHFPQFSPKQPLCPITLDNENGDHGILFISTLRECGDARIITPKDNLCHGGPIPLRCSPMVPSKLESLN